MEPQKVAAQNEQMRVRNARDSDTNFRQNFAAN
jgi:hypothetical protein